VNFQIAIFCTLLLVLTVSVRFSVLHLAVSAICPLCLYLENARLKMQHHADAKKKRGCGAKAISENVLGTVFSMSKMYFETRPEKKV